MRRVIINYTSDMNFTTLMNKNYEELIYFSRENLLALGLVSDHIKSDYLGCGLMMVQMVSYVNILDLCQLDLYFDEVMLAVYQLILVANDLLAYDGPGGSDK